MMTTRGATRVAHRHPLAKVLGTHAHAEVETCLEPGIRLQQRDDDVLGGARWDGASDDDDAISSGFRRRGSPERLAYRGHRRLERDEGRSLHPQWESRRRRAPHRCPTRSRPFIGTVRRPSARRPESTASSMSLNATRCPSSCSAVPSAWPTTPAPTVSTWNRSNGDSGLVGDGLRHDHEVSATSFSSHGTGVGNMDEPARAYGQAEGRQDAVSYACTGARMSRMTGRLDGAR